ncbi:monovalent cation:H+ antiporter-2, CPA2 family [Parapedobacter luteus]|uniref:Monovalent cation:H+ antiporter-2, CPA2 family n=1 Tax=Parapedobacter luteus TaxID=623280 RepID=A0A1T5FLI6_9SPHI|nr:cation:proton antiporter [Parapedobacter luteus]SKB96948.1 monovalent cation:H+ antiporter-2, CPA2 family [Parapedobacter luteus]
MAHLPELIRDLALILLVGAFVTILFKRIRQPLVLGYIIAGFFVGPHFQLIPSIVDTENIETFAELGVIFLLFSLGLEFSFKKLLRVGGHASITAVIEIVFVSSLGYFTGQLLGWSQMDSLFLAGMLASSSTTIILRAFDELGIKTMQFARVVFGVLVVEDIIVILLMVLLSTVAVTQQFEGGEILFTVFKLGFFLMLWFLLGIYLIPSFLKRARQWMDEETLLIFSIGLCLGMVILATRVGFSAELGAFVMGSILAETTLAEKVEHLTKPIKELFGTVFFVSVGMMIDPAAMLQYAFPIVVVTILTIGGKFLFSALGALLSGQPLKQAVQVGMSMAQIGEFAFIVAALGLSLGVISEFLFPIAVGVSAITTFTTPYMIKYSEPFYNWLARVPLAHWKDRIEHYATGTEKLRANPAWKVLFKEYIRIIVINSIVLIAILLLFRYAFLPFIEGKIASAFVQHAVTVAAAMLPAAPFLWAVVFQKPRCDAYQAMWMDTATNKAPLMAIEIVRVLIGVLLVGLFIDRLTSTHVALWITLPVILPFIYLFSRRIQVLYQRIEAHFISNLNERENSLIQADNSGRLNQKNEEVQSGLQAWNAHIVEMEVPPLATYAGRHLKDLGWKEAYGILVVYIRREENIIHLPGGDHRLLPQDHVGILGTDEQMMHFKAAFESQEDIQYNDMAIEDISLHQVMLQATHPLVGKSIARSGLREDTDGQVQVVGVERDGIRMLNPEASLVFKAGDIIWLVGNRKRIREVITHPATNPPDWPPPPEPLASSM